MAGVESDEVAAAFDLLPTFAGLAGAELAQDRKIDGKDIWPILTNRKHAKSPHEAFYYFRGGGKLEAVRSGNWKLRLAKTKGQGDKQEVTAPPELYDLNADISESANLAEENRGMVDELTQMANRFLVDLESEKRPEGKLVAVGKN